jgi:hypothetical protein
VTETAAREIWGVKTDSAPTKIGAHENLRPMRPLLSIDGP